MRKRRSNKEVRKIIIEFIKKNPKTTHLEIRKITGLHPDRAFKGGLEEAFQEAGLSAPRTFKKKTKEEKRNIIVNYIKKHPLAGGQTIAKETKINPSNIFKNIKEAFELAGIIYPRESDDRTKMQKKEQIIKMVQENPLVSIEEITKKVKTQPYHIFSSVEEIYNKAGIEFVKGRKKWRLKKQQEVIDYIKKNPLATQRNINESCKTHVQLLFSKGIFEAYKKAGIKFPYERLKLYGIGIKKIRERAKTFEDEMAIKLSGYGKVNRLVKTKRGFADIIFERIDKKAVIEIKDYQNKEISISQIKQLNKYLEDSECNLGFLICHKKPKKDKFLIDKNKIIILEKSELDKIPSFMSGSVL